MGIAKLADLIRTNAPDAISHKDISDYTGKIIALDASIIINQFRAASPMLSPLTGLLFRTLTLLEHDIKPVFVFDGKPPVEKKALLKKRAEAGGWSVNHTGIASSLTNECVKLLKCLGVPVVQAPGDAEALCAQLVKWGTVDVVASEDMDTLPFGAKTLIRQLNAKKDSDVIEYSLPKLLEKLQITQSEFVDLCILLGCDYCGKIAGFGPKRALTLIQQHRSIEEVVLHINRQTHPIPHSWKYKEARKIFLEELETEAPELCWTEPDEEALVGFLCHVKHIREDRIRRRMERFRETVKGMREKREKERVAEHGRQTRLEDFFRVTRKRSHMNVTDAANSSSINRKKPKTN
ncbi:probable flap endonuclease 1 homolog [Cheilinus undulatus]|uniref:probable flap endonuclease 1 homolog n=1 Tax=Cheilinus undulatus TaxID=241271 RepID=UPI001BD6BEE7|nr:probable flap endonuclease 1 homolog [Cheilinus undulatus]